jgi:hypothetical protein
MIPNVSLLDEPTVDAAPGGSARFRLHRRPRHRPAPVPAGEIVMAPPPRTGRAPRAGRCCCRC